MFGKRKDTGKEIELQKQIAGLIEKRNNAELALHTISESLKSDFEQKRDGFKTEITKLKDDVEKIKLQKKIEEEDIKHMIKMKEERSALDFERKEMELKAKQADALTKEREKCATEIASVKKVYADKTETILGGQISDIKGMYSDIVKMLPDVNARLKINSSS